MRIHDLIVASFIEVAVSLPIPAMSQESASGTTSYPIKPVHVIVGLGPGGATDVQARIFARKLTGSLGQAFVVENRIGAGGTVAFDYVAKSRPDGYTLLATANNFTVSPALYKNLIRYDPVKDFAPISLVVEAPLLLAVRLSLPVRSVQELLALAKAKPGTINAASGGIGTSNHLALELFKSVTGADIIHVPYKGGGQATIDVLAGHADMIFANVISVLPHAKSGKLRALAVTGHKRSAAIPDVPTMGEAGVPGYVNTTWHGWLAPAGTPAAIVNRLNAEIVKTFKDPDVIKVLEADGAELVGSTPAQLNQRIVVELERWGKVVAETNMRPE